MENLIFLFHFLRLTLLHYIYPNPRLSFHFFILFWLLCAFYYCKSLLPTIGRLDPRVPPDSVLLHSTVKLALVFARRRFEKVGRREDGLMNLGDTAQDGCFWLYFPSDTSLIAAAS